MGTDRIDWREDGLCGKSHEEQRRVAGVSVELDDHHHIDMSNEPGRQHVKRVLAVCNACPVLNECREYALTKWPDARWAIIGGLLPSQIAKLKRNAA